MIGYNIVSLKDMLERRGEKETKQFLSTFYCPMNKDVEGFLKNTAIVFEKQGISATYLIFASVKEHMEFIAYFTLAMKTITISSSHIAISKTTKKRIVRFATFDNILNKYVMATPLIGQLGKNYRNRLNKTISGDELLEIACKKNKGGPTCFWWEICLFRMRRQAEAY